MISFHPLIVLAVALLLSGCLIKTKRSDDESRSSAQERAVEKRQSAPTVPAAQPQSGNTDRRTEAEKSTRIQKPEQEPAADAETEADRTPAVGTKAFQDSDISVTVANPDPIAAKRAILRYGDSCRVRSATVEYLGPVGSDPVNYLVRVLENSDQAGTDVEGSDSDLTRTPCPVGTVYEMNADDWQQKVEDLATTEKAKAAVRRLVPAKCSSERRRAR